MQEIVAHLGSGLLELLAVTGAVAFVVSCISGAGILGDAVAFYMTCLCG